MKSQEKRAQDNATALAAQCTELAKLFRSYSKKLKEDADTVFGREIAPSAVPRLAKKSENLRRELFKFEVKALEASPHD